MNESALGTGPGKNLDYNTIHVGFLSRFHLGVEERHTPKGDMPLDPLVGVRCTPGSPPKTYHR